MNVVSNVISVLVQILNDCQINSSACSCPDLILPFALCLDMKNETVCDSISLKNYLLVKTMIGHRPIDNFCRVLFC